MYKYGEEVWQLLQRLPYHQRYYMYGRWKGIHSKSCFSMLLASGMVMGRARYLMKWVRAQPPMCFFPSDD